MRLFCKHEWMPVAETALQSIVGDMCVKCGKMKRRDTTLTRHDVDKMRRKVLR